MFDEYTVPKGSDIFISVWNLHRSPQLWPEPNKFNPDRFPVDGPIPNEVGWQQLMTVGLLISNSPASVVICFKPVQCLLL